MSTTTSAAGAKTGTKTKALCVATRCTTLDQFVTTYHRFCDDTSFFVATTTMRPVGLETAFSIQLADNTPVLRGLCTVLDAWSSPANQFKRPGIRLGIRRLTADSIDVFAKLKAARVRGDGPSLDDPDPATQSQALAKPSPERAGSAASGVVAATTSPRMDSTLPAWATLRPPAKPAEARTQTGTLAPSQTTKPIPIVAGAAQAMAPVAVETLDGKFPVLPRTQTGKAPPVAAPVPLPVEPPRTKTAVPRALGSAPSLDTMLSHPASRVAQGTSEPTITPPSIVPPQTQPIAMPRTTTGRVDTPAIPRTATPVARITPPPIAAQQPPLAKRTPPPMPAQPPPTATPATMAADTGWSDDAPTAGPKQNPLGWSDDAPTVGPKPNPLAETPAASASASTSSAIGNMWSQEAQSSEAVPEAIPAAKLQAGPSEAIRALLAKRATTPPAVPITPAAPALPVKTARAPEPPPVDNEPTSEGLALGQMEYGGSPPDLDSDTAVNAESVALGQMTYERPAPPPALAEEDKVALGQMSYGNAGARETVPDFEDESPPVTVQRPTPLPADAPAVPRTMTANKLEGVAVPRTTTTTQPLADAPALPRTTTANSVDGVAVPRTMTPHPLAGVALPRTLTPNPELAVSRTSTGTLISAAIDNARVDDPNRTPGSEMVLPANPLQHLTDDMLTGFIECTLYEETANFIREDGAEVGDEAAAPPRPRTTTGHPFMATYVVDEATGSFIGPIMPPGFVAQPGSYVGPIPVAPMGPMGPMATMPMPPIATPGRMHTPTSPPMFATTGTIPVIGDPAAPAPIPGAPLAVAAAEPTLAVRTRRQAVPRWLIVGASAFVALVVLVLVVVLVKKTGKDSEPAAEGKPATSASDPRNGAKPDDKSPEQAGANPGSASPDEHPDKPDILSANGLPVTGQGPCRLVVNTTPAGSLVAFDGQSVGPSPIIIDGTCAQHRVDLAHARYANATRTVTLEDKKPQTLEVTLNRPTHAVTVVTVPGDATVYIEGRPAGTSPTVVQVSGYYAVSLMVEKKGFKTVRQKIYSKQTPDRVTIWLKKDL